MLPATNYLQGWRPARAGEPLTRHGMPASVAAHNQFKFPARSPDLLPLRATCRGVKASALYSRIARRMPSIGLSNRRADRSSRRCQSATNSLSAQARAGVQTVHVASLLDTYAGHHVCQDIADVPECHNLERLSSRDFDEVNPIERASQGRGTFTQEPGKRTQGASRV